MSQVFHDIEIQIINSLKENPIQTPETLENSTQLSPDQIRRGIEWLKLKDLAIVDESKSSVLRLGKNGLDSFEKGLPERRLLNLIKSGPKKLSEIQKELGFVFGPAIGLCRKNNWIETSSDQIILKTIPSELPGEKSLQLIGNNKLPKEQTDKISDLNQAATLKRGICPICDQTFSIGNTGKRNVRRHIKSIHNEDSDKFEIKTEKISD